MIPPGSTIGIIGGGQLGRMLAIAAANLGYRTHIYAPGTSGPATEVAAQWTRGAYEDADAVAVFAAQVDVVTYEFENVVVEAIAGLAGIRPSARSLEVSQDRVAEKRFAEGQGGRPARWRAVSSAAELDAALAEIGAPAILKTRRFGYDGKGQARIGAPGEAAAAWEAIGGAPAVLEAMIAFDAEFSILLVRGADGGIVAWDAVENEHREGILRRSSVPAAGLIAAQAAEAQALAARLAGALDHVGVLACEFFATADGPIFNEMAPRVHNSGHWTIEGSLTSQFENHIRAICGLPLGSTALTGRGAEMRNLLGDEAETWAAILADPAAHLHLYGKGKSRPGRKMGHVTRVW
ncbi:5-(carboxyamino)imidazole ribonucleotide synthase [Sphingomonas bacterium]|uniref:5-(carboxyamino)imidazole ribonucleotide synthase n=1 Tax=Sphingomonas bacterium TaxID=1895847 RepID=UPI001575833B|nr:5-(carboxyamino)imidazole ribonucleotide synthase [Sphingomonas bacterium]